MTGLPRMRSPGQKCLEDPQSVPYVSSGSCKADTLLIDWRSGGGIVTEEVLIHWLSRRHIAGVSLTARPQETMLETMFMPSLGQETPKSWFGTISSNVTVRALDLIGCAKLPRMLASLSRHSSCLGSWLAGWRCQRVCPLPCVANSSQLPQLIWRENGMETEIVLLDSK